MARSRSRLENGDHDDDLYAYFNKSVTAVQAHADHFEQEYARPALRTSQEFFDERPIAATFIVIFSFLSFIPVASFLGLSLFAVASITIIALTSTIIASATVVLTLLSLLILTLMMTLAASAVLTLSGISLYSFWSLANLVREHGRTGISRWMEHMSTCIFGDLSTPYSSPRLREIHDHDAEWSDSEDAPNESDVKLEPLDIPYHGSEPDTPVNEDEPTTFG
ncbi:hypothetical protein LshimejAT787_0703080 [Lyophyllum shimeji]|uniref:Uncharacterized protein n=1 Tax=Lyophyllum shimeji TaxID=47721 RepID=A0A9P3PQM7_LYOSH|nr:hypothetical protein LshimejAT787_0703080 [Lyophyllum shimeji]